MSALTRTQRELLYCSTQASTPISISQSVESSLMLGLPPVFIPSGYFNKVGRSLSVKCVGQYSPVGSNSVWSVYLSPSPAFDSTVSTKFVSNSTANNGGSFALFFLTIDIVVRSIGIGQTSVLAGMGDIHCPSAFNTGGAMGCIPANANLGGAVTITNFDAELDRYLMISLFNGGSPTMTNATIQILKVYGEN